MPPSLYTPSWDTGPPCPHAPLASGESCFLGLLRLWSLPECPWELLPLVCVLNTLAGVPKVLLGSFLLSLHVCPQGFSFHVSGGDSYPAPHPGAAPWSHTAGSPDRSPQRLQRHVRWSVSQTKLVISPVSLTVSPFLGNDTDVHPQHKPAHQLWELLSPESFGIRLFLWTLTPVVPF